MNSAGLGYSERSIRSQACSTDDLSLNYRRLMASGMVSSSSAAAVAGLSRSQSSLVAATSSATSVFMRKRRQLPKCPEEGLSQVGSRRHVTLYSFAEIINCFHLLIL